MLHDPGTSHRHGWEAVEPVFHSSPSRYRAEEAWRARDDVLERMIDGIIEWDQGVLNALARQAEALEEAAYAHS